MTEGIVFSDIIFTYTEGGKVNTLDGASLSLAPGRISVVTGASGCGKSTMLYLAAGIYPKNGGEIKSGSVTVDGQNPADIKPYERAKIIGMMFQNPDLQFCMDTVKNELIFCLENVREAPEKMDEIIDEALQFCNIMHLKERKLATLSGGEKQKAMMACIAALRPKYLLLDEPFANIDRDASKELAEGVKKMRDLYGTGVVAVDHHLDMWTEIADEIIVIEKGGALYKRGIDPKNLPEAELAEIGVAVPNLPYQAHIPAKTPTEKEVVVKLRGVRVSYEKEEVLKGIDADFYKGRIHAVIGESGSGKSTLFNTLCRLNKYEGSILIEGEELKKIPRKKMGHKMGFVFQNPQDQFLADTVFDEIAVGLKKIIGEEKTAEEAERILRGIGLWRYRLISPFMLSQGQQRRLAVAALLAYECNILVCDEPTYAQDRNSLLAVMQSLQEIVVKSGLTLVFSTHDRKLAHDYADHTYEMREGKLHEVDQSDV